MYIYIYIYTSLISYHIKSNQIKSYQIISYIISNQIISYHFISYHIKYNIYHSTLVHHPVSNHDRRDADGMRVLSWKGNTTLLDMENIFPGKKENNGKSTLATKQIAVLLVTSLPSSTKCFTNKAPFCSISLLLPGWNKLVGSCWPQLSTIFNRLQLQTRLLQH